MRLSYRFCIQIFLKLRQRSALEELSTLRMFIEGTLRQPIDLLSKGEQQRLAICGALAPEPHPHVVGRSASRVDEQIAKRFDKLLEDHTLQDTVLFAATHRPKDLPDYFRSE